MNNEKIQLFVPGRLCLIGEHSDWAGLHRVINSKIIPGQAIVTGIEQGIYATAEKNDKFVIDSELECYQGDSFACEMDSAKLRETANEGKFFSYVAGVASYVNDCYNVGGLHITITKMDLPIKSGLSSSAAICVLVARAFNILYKLHLNTMGEMNIAYIGEQRTPSRCGRLDQACAYGVNPVRMVFDGNEISVEPLVVKKPLHWVIADLNSHKDTVKILSDLNKCFPFAQNEMEETVQEALGEDNRSFIKEAVDCIEQGDNEKLGELMVRYQQNFDKKIAPASYEELRAPILHSVLEDENIRPWIYGAKGVGSQGDGTVQLLAKDEACQEKVIEYLKNERGMESFKLTLKPQQAIRKAVIPVAGFGTRLFPATKVMKKDFFPVMDRDGILKPVILILLEQLLEAGIEQICLVIGEGEEELYQEFFNALSKEHYDKLPDEKKEYEDLLQKVGEKVTYVYQKERRGFGHAVYQCRDFVDGEPVLLLLGDMIYHSERDENCMTQMISVYEKTGLPVISMHRINKEDVVHYGILHGEWEDTEQRVLKLTQITEKPAVDYAADYLKVKTKESSENYYAVFGQYILTKEVFEALEETISKNHAEQGEIQLTDALEQTRKRIGAIGYVVDGRSYDVGLPQMYIRTVGEYYK